MHVRPGQRTVTQEGINACMLGFSTLESSNFIEDAHIKFPFFLFREDEHICCVLYTGPRVLTGMVYIPVVFCDQIVFFTTTSSSSYMVPHRGILFCFQRKEQGAYAFIFFLKFQGIPVTSMQDTGIRCERDNHRSGIYKTIFL